jgi:hypothetical protein
MRFPMVVGAGITKGATTTNMIVTEIGMEVTGARIADPTTPGIRYFSGGRASLIGRSSLLL